MVFQIHGKDKSDTMVRFVQLEADDNVISLHDRYAKFMSEEGQAWKDAGVVKHWVHTQASRGFLVMAGNVMMPKGDCAASYTQPPR